LPSSTRSETDLTLQRGLCVKATTVTFHEPSKGCDANPGEMKETVAAIAAAATKLKRAVRTIFSNLCPSVDWGMADDHG
jgi:hypothetical protein